MWKFDLGPPGRDDSVEVVRKSRTTSRISSPSDDPDRTVCPGPGPGRWVRGLGWRQRNVVWSDSWISRFAWRFSGTAAGSPGGYQLRQEGVPEANIHHDVGVSGGTGTNSRAGWRALNARLVSGDTVVVVAIDRIGRRWMDTVNAVRDLRTREVGIRSLAQTEATWVTYLASEPDTAEAVIGDILTTFMAWAAEQELQAVSRRTRAGLERARAEGKTLGPPPRVDDDQVEAMARLRQEGQSFRSIGRIFGVSRTTVQRRLQEQEAVNLEDSQTS